MKKIFLVILISFSALCLNAQTNVDSLWEVWSNESLTDTIRLEAVNEYIRSDELTLTPDSAQKIRQEMLAFAILKDNKSYQGIAYYHIGYLLQRESNYNEAVKNYFKALESLKEGNNKGEKYYFRSTHFELGSSFTSLGQYPLSIKHYSISAQLNEERGGSSAAELHNIGLIYYFQEEYSKALDLFEKSAKQHAENNDVHNEAIATGNIGRVHSELGNYSKAIFYLNKKIEMLDEQNPQYNCGMMSTLAILGETYMKMKDYEQALNYLKQSLDFRNKDSFLCSTKILESKIGTVYEEMGQWDLAIEWCTKGYNIAIKKSQLPEKPLACDCLYKAYEGKGNYKKALEYLKIRGLLNDSLDREESIKSLQQMEFAKAQLTDSLQQNEEKLKVEMAHQLEVVKKDKTRNLLMGVGLFLLLAAMGLYTRVRYVRKANIRIEEEREKAVKSEAFKQQFLANMSHEIRTPMNAVMGMTSLLLDKQPREDQFKYLDGIRTSSDNLLHIINDILDLSKIESGKMELEHIDFSLKATIEHVKKILDHKAAEKGLELLMNIESNVTDVVIGDPTRLNQVLINLAGNAIKFTEKGSVSMVVNNVDKGIQFSIVDTGIGIPEDKLQSVFENFTQANSSDTRKYGGTGLGLSISRQLVDIMGGKITVESKEGYGTTFSFVLEFEPGSVERLEERLALDKDVDGSILDGLTILITDDNEYNRIVAKDTLMSKANVVIHEAEDGQQAIDMVAKMSFDVILMDIQMPGMNGFDATRYIRANFESPVKDTPIIALTASVLRTDLDKCKDAGMDSYIPKPFKAQQLIAGIAQTLGIKLKINKNLSKKEEVKVVSDSKIDSFTNMTYLHGFCEGDVEKMKKYIGMFTSTAPALIEKIQTSLEQNEFENIANHVHAFKTKWIMMGMTETKNLAIELERQCREGQDLQGITENAELLIVHIAQALFELNEVKS